MIIRAGHSRLPVFEENLDNIVGIVFVKDLVNRVTAARISSAE